MGISGKLDRRTLVGGGLGAAVAATVAGGVFARPIAGEKRMYGLIGKMKSVAGKRDVLAAVLLEGDGGMPGCLSYIVAEDPADPDALWITEVWDSAESHKASLQLPAVQDAIARGRPLIAGFENGVETAPLGGIGLK